MLTKKLIFTGWKDGVKTIALAKLIHSETDLNFAKAKQVVDELLDDKEPFIFVSKNIVVEFMKECMTLGANIQIEGDNN